MTSRDKPQQAWSSPDKYKKRQNQAKLRQTNTRQAKASQYKTKQAKTTQDKPRQAKPSPNNRCPPSQPSAQICACL